MRVEYVECTDALCAIHRAAQGSRWVLLLATRFQALLRGGFQGEVQHATVQAALVWGKDAQMPRVARQPMTL